ncbi:hypothetical protein SNE40_017675 [Patella caerulea]|uniref:Anoctamin n=1 Tax=Patella caerulea TaxID=87958 RepID=A0AAN8PEI5_PATCE
MEKAHHVEDVHRNSKDVREPFVPLVIIQFASSTKQAAITWMIAKLQASRHEGGAELTVQTMVMPHSDENKEDENSMETMLYIGANTNRLLLAAEMMEMKKLHVDGHMREVVIHDLQSFQGSDDLSTFFTKGEKQKILLHEIEGVRAEPLDTNIPGYEQIKLYPGKSILKKYLSRGLVLQFYPLHDEEEIKRLGDEWYQYQKVFSEQPLDKIRNYFGEKIAIYFAFLGIYTVALFPPALIGIIYLVTFWKSVYREAIFAVFNLIWSTLLLEAWKRYSSELSYKWGTLNSSSALKIDEPRADYSGDLGRNPVTGNPEPVYPKWKRSCRFYLVSVPIISICLIVAFVVMLLYFWMQAWADSVYHSSGERWLYLPILYTPTIVYSVAIFLMNTVYRMIAKELNDFENHRLESSHENHFILKLVLFDFVNCFMSLFYVAFYLQDRTLLRSHLACLLITSQLIGQVQEAMVPYFFFKRRETQLAEAMKKSDNLKQLDGRAEIDKTIQKQAVLEGTMSVYEGTMDDYLELFLQFGYVFLFSSAFPLAALWALLNNVTEIRTDAFKMCRVYQRPFCESASNIGAWQVAFEVIGLISVITNTALIGMDPTVQKLLPSDMSAVNIVLIFVIVEHVVLAIKGAVAYFIPDMPKWVQIELAREDYQSKQALQKERLQAANRKRQELHEISRPRMSSRSTEI